MAQEPFTEAGVSSKFSDLYALSDSNLQTEADSVASNFRTWVATNFLLDTGQSDFLTSLDDKWVAVAAANLSMAMSYRVLVTITINDPPNATVPPNQQGKWINYTPPIWKDGPGSNSVVASGSLSFEIGYDG